MILINLPRSKNGKRLPVLLIAIEGFITNYLRDSKDHKDSVYYFLYEFLQYDSSSDFKEIIKRRAKSVCKIIDKLEDNIEAFKNYFHPNYLKYLWY